MRLFPFLLIITAFINMSFMLKNKIRKISPQIYYRVSDGSDVCQVLSKLVNCPEGSLKSFLVFPTLGGSSMVRVS